MPIIREAGKMIQLYKFKALLLDEFIPLIEYNQTKHAIFLGKISTDSKELTLSPLINRESRTMKPSVLTTESRSIRLPFTVKKGCSSSLDKDGIVTIKFSIDSKEIRLVGSNPVAACLDSEMEVEIDINSQSDVEFNVDFYASDDIEDEKNVGEAKNVHCGRFKVCFNYKIITDWPNVAPVIQKDKFVGWNYPGVRENCFHYALHQLKVAGYWVKSERWNKKWDGTKELNDYIYQLYLEKDVAGMKKGVQTDQFDKGVEYLKKRFKKVNRF